MRRTVLLDVVQKAPQESQFRLLELFDRVAVGDTIRVISDAGIAPVCQALFEEREGQFICEARREGHNEWVARIIKVR